MRPASEDSKLRPGDYFILDDHLHDGTFIGQITEIEDISEYPNHYGCSYLTNVLLHIQWLGNGPPGCKDELDYLMCVDSRYYNLCSKITDKFDLAMHILGS